MKVRIRKHESGVFSAKVEPDDKRQRNIHVPPTKGRVSLAEAIKAAITQAKDAGRTRNRVEPGAGT